MDQVGRVHEPALDRIRLAGDRRLTDTGGDGLRREGKALVRVVHLAARRRRVRRIRIGGHLHARRVVEAAFATPAAEQRIQQRDGAAALRIVAIPGGVASRVYQRRGTVTRHFARRCTDDFGRDPRFRVSPLRRVLRQFGLEVVEAVAVLRDVSRVVQALGHEDVHPGEQQREVRTRLHRQVVLRLARCNREARVRHDDRRAVAVRLRELLHLRVVHVLAEVRADQHQAAGIADVGAFWRTDFLAVRQVEAHVARTAALRKRRSRAVGDAVRPERVLEERAADAVAEQGDRFWPVFRLDRSHALGDVPERLVPGHLDPLFLAACLVPQQRRAQAVGIDAGADAARAAGAEPALAQRIVRVADDLPQAAIANVRDGIALPEADVAVRRNGADAGCACRHRATQRPGRGRSQRGGPSAEAGDLEKSPARNAIHDLFPAPH